MSTAAKLILGAALAVMAVSALTRLAATRNRNGRPTVIRYTSPSHWRVVALTAEPPSTSPATITYRFDLAAQSPTES